jgi:hypothetical protein
MKFKEIVYLCIYPNVVRMYTFGQKYISVYTEICIWPKVYVQKYDNMCNSICVCIPQYEFFRYIIYWFILGTCLYILLKLFFCFDWEGTYSYIPIRLSTYYVQLLCSSRPAACTLLARCTLRALEFESRAFVAETRQTWSRTNKLIIMSAATGLASSCLLFGSSRRLGAIGSTGSARQRLRARQRRCMGDEFALQCCRQR